MRTKSELQPVGTILNAMLAQRGYLRICRDNQALLQWPALVGEKIAAESACERVDNGVLYVRVPAASWRQELSYMKPDIIKKIRAEISGTSIHDIVFS